MNSPSSRHLLVVETARRLVEEEEPRLRDERARELDALLDPVRQRRRWEERPVAEPDDVEHLQGVGLRRALRPRPCAPTSTFSRTDIVRKSWMFWNVRATPLRTILNAGCFRSEAPSRSTSPESGRVQARDDVERGRLAGAVRPDQA